MIIADRLSLLMKERGYTNVAVERETGISNSHISALRNGKKGIETIDAAIALCDLFSVSLDYLLGRSDERGGGTKKAPALEISENGRRMLDIYLLLDKEQQAFLLGEASGMQRENEKKRGQLISEGKAV